MTSTVLVVDFGAQYAQLIARRVREAHVYSEIVPSTITAEEVAARQPSAIVLSGGPKSVYETPAPSLDPAIYELGVPILGICYGAQLMAQQLGGEVAATGGGEYGRTELSRHGVSDILVDVPATSHCWMSHGDAISAVPPGFHITASTPLAPIAVMENSDRRLYGVQYHPEVAHCEYGQEILERFLHLIAEIPATWTNTNIIDEQVELIRSQVGSERVLCALSGGVDSAVAAALVTRAVGQQLTCVFVDTGLMRSNEGEQIEQTFVRQFGVYEKVPAEQEVGKTKVSITWVDVNKGDASKPEYRSRLVGRELRRLDPFMSGTVAANPPTESLRFMLSNFMTRRTRKGRRQELTLGVLDVSRAHFHPPAEREVYIDLPAEDHEPGMVGKLLKTIYGTRDAAAQWEKFYTDVFVAIGFVAGSNNQAVSAIAIGANSG